ncbi:MAG: glycosyltransferase family 4 protein [Ktedonobacterales bacterium]
MAVLMVEPDGQGGICHYTYCLANSLRASGEAVTLATSRSYELLAAVRRFELITPFGPGIERRIVQRLTGRARHAQLRSPGAVNATTPAATSGARAPAVTPVAAAGFTGRLSRAVSDFEYRRGWHSLIRAATARHVTTVHVQWLKAPAIDVQALSALRRRGKAIVLTVHNVVPHDAPPAASAQWSAVYRSADALIVHYRGAADELVALGVEPQRIEVIPLGNYLPIAVLSGWSSTGEPAQEQARKLLGLAAGVPLVLFFGLMRPYKGIEYLLEAFAAVRQRIPNAKLLLAGQAVGGYGRIAEQIARWGIGDSVTALPRYLSLEDAGRCFAAADIVALPYVEGTQSAVVQLAYAFARPVVATSVGGIPEIVRDGATGRLIAPRDAQALAQALEQSLDDRTWCRAAGERGYAFARDEYGWDAIARQTTAVYRAASGSGTPPPPIAAAPLPESVPGQL